MKIEVITTTTEETRMLGEKMGKTARPGAVFALTGELGSGKTVLAKGIALGMGITDPITSPTFNLMDVYEAVIPLYHFDLYRLNNEAELDELFFEEYWEGSGVSVIEWAEKAGTRLPAGTILVTIAYLDAERRRIIIEYPHL